MPVELDTIPHCEGPSDLQRRENRKTRFRQVRGELGLSMQAIAGQLGINRDTWSRYETKGGMPTMAILRRVSKLTGKPSDYLRGE